MQINSQYQSKTDTKENVAENDQFWTFFSKQACVDPICTIYMISQPLKLFLASMICLCQIYGWVA